MKRLVISVLFFTGIAALLLLLVLHYMDVYTKKGETVNVPSLIGKTEAEIADFSSVGLDFTIIDSVYDKSEPKGVVINQTPKPGTKVKSARTVYLTINCRKPRLLHLPDVIDKSVAHGISSLEKAGFKIGRIDTIHDEFPVILQITQNGVALARNRRIQEESVVDLTIGDGQNR